MLDKISAFEAATSPTQNVRSNDRNLGADALTIISNFFSEPSKNILAT
jgi:hypothetical protein